MWEAGAIAGSGVMCAIGWYVQLVHYPTFHLIPEDRWHKFHRDHASRTGIIVLPAMALELISAAMLMSNPGKGLAVALSWVALSSALFAIGWTFGVSSLLHQTLSKGYDEKTVQKLIVTNLPRTIAWTVHLIAAVAFTSLRG